MSTQLEEAATAALDDADYQVVSAAAKVLGEYSSTDAEKALWRRLEKLHEAVQGQEFSDDKLSDEEWMEEALRKALISGQAWLMDPEKLKRLGDLCFTDESQDEVDQRISGWDPQIYVAFHSLMVNRLRLASRIMKSSRWIH